MLETEGPRIHEHGLAHKIMSLAQALSRGMRGSSSSGAQFSTTSTRSGGIPHFTRVGRKSEVIATIPVSLPEKASPPAARTAPYHSSCYRQLPPQQPVNCQPIDVPVCQTTSPAPTACIAPRRLLAHQSACSPTTQHAARSSRSAGRANGHRRSWRKRRTKACFSIMRPSDRPLTSNEGGPRAGDGADLVV